MTISFSHVSTGRQDAWRLPAEREPAGPDVSARRLRERLEFKVLLAVTFPLFLAAAMVQSLSSAPAGGPGAPGRSLFKRASALANGTIPYAFMG
jgi:hypothetical protein